MFNERWEHASIYNRYGTHLFTLGFSPTRGVECVFSHSAPSLQSQSLNIDLSSYSFFIFRLRSPWIHKDAHLTRIGDRTIVFVSCHFTLITLLPTPFWKSVHIAIVNRVLPVHYSWYQKPVYYDIVIVWRNGYHGNRGVLLLWFLFMFLCYQWTGFW